RFGSPLVLSRVHWVRPELVAEVKYLTWTDDNLLRQVVYEGCAKTSPQPKSDARCRIRSPVKNSRCTQRRLHPGAAARGFLRADQFRISLLRRLEHDRNPGRSSSLDCRA